MAGGSSASLPRSAAGRHNPWLIAIVVSLATFMEVLDTTIANVSLRHIAGGLGASQDEATWILTSYLISNAIILPVSGWLATLIGTPLSVLAERDGTGHAENFARIALPHGTAPGQIIAITPTRIVEGLLA